MLIPEKILQVRERKLRNRVIREYLVQWKELPIEDATWEGEQVLQHPGLQLLEDKQFQAGRTVMSSSNCVSKTPINLFNSHSFEQVSMKNEID